MKPVAPERRHPNLLNSALVASKRVYVPRQRNRPPGLFQVHGRTFGVIQPKDIPSVEELREAYLSFRPALDGLNPPPNPNPPPMTSTGEELFMGELPEVFMPEFEDMREPNVLLEARGQPESFFKWEGGMLQLRGKTFSAEQVADIMKVWIAQDE